MVGACTKGPPSYEHTRVIGGHIHKGVQENKTILFDGPWNQTMMMLLLLLHRCSGNFIMVLTIF
jgi:hypothetical protein